MNISVVVHPRSKQPRIIEQKNILHVYINEVATENKANIAATAALAKHFKI